MSGAGTPIAPGTRVRLRYRLVLSDGRQLAGSGEEPEEITLGDGTLVEGLEALLIGLKAGDARIWELGAGEMIFGWPDEDMVRRLPAGEFPPDMDLSPGNVVLFNSPGGTEVLGIIQSADGDEVTVDFNHPLTGRDFTFEVEIVEVTPPR